MREKAGESVREKVRKSESERGVVTERGKERDRETVREREAFTKECSIN